VSDAQAVYEDPMLGAEIPYANPPFHILDFAVKAANPRVAHADISIYMSTDSYW
jgi:hypothetical protein